MDFAIKEFLSAMGYVFGFMAGAILVRTYLKTSIPKFVKNNEANEMYTRSDVDEIRINYFNNKYANIAAGIFLGMSYCVSLMSLWIKEKDLSENMMFAGVMFGIAIGSIMARIVKKEVDREKQKRLNIEIEKFSNEC